MRQPLDEQYFVWLYQKVASVRLKNPARTYWSLLRQLHTTEFVWFIPNDDNRVVDGQDLRQEFLDEVDAQGDQYWLAAGCSFLEMLIALSRRLNFEDIDGVDSDEWFWRLLKNIGLDEYSDLYFKNHFTVELVAGSLRLVNQRTYQADGSGGLFPLRHAEADQRRVELWYQMSAYLLEGEEGDGLR